MTQLSDESVVAQKQYCLWLRERYVGRTAPTASDAGFEPHLLPAVGD